MYSFPIRTRLPRAHESARASSTFVTAIRRRTSRGVMASIHEDAAGTGAACFEVSSESCGIGGAPLGPADGRQRRPLRHQFASHRRTVAEQYLCDAPVVYPPIDVERFAVLARRGSGGDYITVSRLVRYKRVDLVIEGFRRLPRRRLVVIGEGPERARLARSLPPNVSLLGRVDETDLRGGLAEAASPRRSEVSARLDPLAFFSTNSLPMHSSARSSVSKRRESTQTIAAKTPRSIYLTRLRGCAFG